jgi:hypothetical protein
MSFDEKKADIVYSVYNKLYSDLGQSLDEILQSGNRAMLILHCAKIATFMNQALAIAKELDKQAAQA